MQKLEHLRKTTLPEVHPSLSMHIQICARASTQMLEGVLCLPSWIIVIFSGYWLVSALRAWREQRERGRHWNERQIIKEAWTDWQRVRTFRLVPSFSCYLTSFRFVWSTRVKCIWYSGLSTHNHNNNKPYEINVRFSQKVKTGICTFDMRFLCITHTLEVMETLEKTVGKQLGLSKRCLLHQSEWTETLSNSVHCCLLYSVSGRPWPFVLNETTWAARCGRWDLSGLLNCFHRNGCIREGGGCYAQSTTHTANVLGPFVCFYT